MKLKYTLVVLSFLFCSISFGQGPKTIAFTEVSEKAGINHAFQVDLATFGGGATVFDMNNDGWEDLYITGGGAQDALYRNNGDGTFTDVFEGAGFDRTNDIYTQGVASADINRDGYRDLMITSFYHLDFNRTIAPSLLYLNNGDGTFTDVTESWGLDKYLSNSQAASFGDINADGFPDLFICNYYHNTTVGFSIYNEETISNSFQAAPDFLFLNIGGKYFQEVSKEYGVDHVGFGFQGVFTDIDNDQDADLLIVNDFGFKSTPNILLRNEFPIKKMTNKANSMALNYGMNAMGIGIADYNFDGWMDYFVTNLSRSIFTVSQGAGSPFIDQAFELGLGIPVLSDAVYTGPPISWGTNFFDYDHDTDTDLFVSNGALNPTTRPNPNMFFELRDGQFVEMSRILGLNDYRIGRGSVVFDYDNDGDLDLFVVNQLARDPSESIPVGKCLLYRNDLEEKGNWLKVALEGVKAESYGLGSKVELQVNNKLLIREIDGGSGHNSQSSTIAHFGLGDAEEVESVTVKWLGGKVQTLNNVKANQSITIRENEEPAFNFQVNRLDIYPNIFQDELTIEFSLEKESNVKIDLVDIRGRLVSHIIEYDRPVQTGFFRWEEGNRLLPGTYFISIVTDEDQAAQKLVKVGR